MDSTKKVFIMGIDGMDPKITQQYLNEGIMPNLEKFLKRGAARENLAMIGGQPTVTPPMWTTLATGASPFVHSVH
ncbi:MAG: nucleotide pyrophosphatase, partial [Clostridiales bacterium]